MKNNFLFKKVILNNDELNFIKDYILEHEDEIKKLGPDDYVGTSDNSLTGRHKCFNWLTTPIGDILIPKLRNVFKELKLTYPIGVQCWANTFRYDEGITKHSHGDWKFLCSNLFLDGPTDIGTYYFEESNWNKYESVKGELTLFNSLLGHYVPNNKTDNIRMSIAMDIYPKEYIKEAWKDITSNKQRYIILD